jgi:hypothetical protein
MTLSDHKGKQIVGDTVKNVSCKIFDQYLLLTQLQCKNYRAQRLQVYSQHSGVIRVGQTPCRS